MTATAKPSREALRTTRDASKRASASHAGREIGPPPPITDRCRRKKAASDFLAFYRGYLAESIPTPAALALWAVLTKRRAFVVLAADTRVEAKRQFELALAELATNDRLLADWPEVCFPIRHIRRGQRSAGRPTGLSRTTNKLILPGAAAVLAVATIGRAFSMSHGTIQPDLIVYDDPARIDRDTAHATRVADPARPLDAKGPAVRLVICSRPNPEPAIPGRRTRPLPRKR